MGYQPFLIAPFKTGLQTDLQPWIAPADAFVNIENGHIHHEYIEKRQGFRVLGQMVHGVEISAATSANPAVFTVTSASLLSDGDTVTLHYLEGGNWGNLNGLKYTIQNLSGTNFELVDSNGTTVDGSTLGAYTASSGRLGILTNKRMMGIFRFIASNNTRKALVSDTERVAIYNPSNGLFEPLDLYDITSTLRTNSDVWSSSDSDYIWAANWQAAGLVNRVYFTNGKAYQSGTPGTDGIVYYDDQNTRVEQFQPSLNDSDTLYGCKLLFSIKQRLVALHTFEYNGSTTNTFPQRARCCAAQNPSNWNDTTPGGGAYVDAPTGDQIVSARQIQDKIIVYFTDSVWALVPTSNPALPFRWVKLNSYRACDGKMASVGFDRYVVASGQRGITATDGTETRRVDERIQDFIVDDVNDDEFDKIFFERSYANTQTWMLYPAVESDDSNGVLVYDEDSGSYSKYIFKREVDGTVVDMNVLGYGEVSYDYAAEDFTAANNLDVSASAFDTETALSFFWSENSEIFLGGDRNGYVHIMETEGSDNGTSIEFILESSGWNPYKQDGVEVQFGYVDFYCDSDQKTKLTVEFYKNDSETPYKTQGMDLLPDLTFRSEVSGILPNSDPTTGFLITSHQHGISEDEFFYMYGIEGCEIFNDEQFQADSVTANTISVAKDITSFGFAITGITQANPAVVTSAGHGFKDGNLVYIVNVSGMTEVNGNTYEVANATDDTFELLGINSSAYTAYSSGGYVFNSYTSGGQITERRFYRKKVVKRAYAGGIGYTHNIRVQSEGVNRPLHIDFMKPYFRPIGKRILG